MRNWLPFTNCGIKPIGSSIKSKFQPKNNLFPDFQIVFSKMFSFQHKLRMLEIIYLQRKK